MNNERPASYFSSFAKESQLFWQIHETTLTNGCNKFWQVKQFISALPGRSRVNLTSKFTSIYWVTVWQWKAKIGLGSDKIRLIHEEIFVWIWKRLLITDSYLLWWFANNDMKSQFAKKLIFYQSFAKSFVCQNKSH